MPQGQACVRTGTRCESLCIMPSLASPLAAPDGAYHASVVSLDACFGNDFADRLPVDLLDPLIGKFRATGLKRDNLVSVMYAEKLDSGKSSAILQRTDRHGILDQKSADFQRLLC